MKRFYVSMLVVACSAAVCVGQDCSSGTCVRVAAPRPASVVVERPLARAVPRVTRPAPRRVWHRAVHRFVPRCCR